MKNILLTLLAFAGFLFPVQANAQTASFSVPYDTVYASVSGVATINDNILNFSTPAGLYLHWHVSASDFPADWLTSVAFGICDNRNCYNNADDTLWNMATSYGYPFVSVSYVEGDTGLFDLSLNLTYSTTLGSHYVTITITDPGSFYSKNVTFVINKIPTSVNSISKASENVLFYPNPATTDLNVVYDASLDIKTISLYNIIGKLAAVYKVPASSANLNLENIPSGIYFVRLVNSLGEAVITRKFTKQ